MLTHDFNINDLGFVKVWSNYQLTGDITPQIENLKTLALKGQPNAIAKWYDFFQPGKCPELDEMTKSLDTSDFETMLAKGYFEKHFGQKNLNNLVEIYKNIIKTDMLYQIHDKHARNRIERHYFHAREKQQINDIKENSYLQYFRHACKNAYYETEKENIDLRRFYLQERAHELMLEYCFQLPNIGNLANDRESKLKNTKKSIEKELKTLLAEYKHKFEMVKSKKLLKISPK